MPGALAQLPPDLLATMAAGVSVLVASRGDDLHPSVMRAMGCRIDRDAGTGTVFLSRRQSHDLLRDIERSGRVAAMFSQPSTHLSVQLKASRAAVRAAAPNDRETLDAYGAAVVREIQSIGYPPALVRAMLSWELDDLAAVSFEPDEAFDQTPGPRAGAALGTAA